MTVATSPPPPTDAALARQAQLTAAPVAVEVEALTKTFRLPHQQFHTLKERVLHPFRSTTFDELRALNDVSLTIKQGEFFGIVGRNGSGKSTLLKCLAGIYRPDAGAVRVHGRLSPFIELGVGFNPDLTAYDNVVINAVMLGLSRREARAAFEEIIAFSELEEFVDLKLKNYSSGMAVRLGFATAIQVEAEVLVVDEVLAVGDAAFQQKCMEQFQRLKDEGRTVVFVTHDMGSAERFCDRAMLIERGDVLRVGEPHEIAKAYNELNFGRLAHEVPADGAEDAAPIERMGDHREVEILEAWCESDGRRVDTLGYGHPLQLVVKLRAHAAVEDPEVAMTVRNDAGHTIFVASSSHVGTPIGHLDAGQEAVVRFATTNWLAQSAYRITPSVARAGSGADVLDLREDLVPLFVHTTKASGGIVDLPHSVHVERSA